MSTSCNLLCDEELGTYTENECQESVPGGSNQAIFLLCGHNITDASSYAQVHAAIVAETAILVQGASFGIPAASPNKITTKVPCRSDTLLNYNRTFTYYNPNVSVVNSAFHDKAFSGLVKFQGLIIYECGADQVTFIDEPFLFTGNRVLTESEKEEQYYQGVGEWVSRTDPQITAVPLTIFS